MQQQPNPILINCQMRCDFEYFQPLQKENRKKANFKLKSIIYYIYLSDIENLVLTIANIRDGK